MATATRQTGNTKETANYTVDPSGFGYSVINDSIKSDFNFLVNELPQKLDEAMTEIQNATAIDTAFDFENGSSVKDISVARDELQTDVNNLKTELNNLYQAFMTDIDNINYELEYNFGWILIGKVKGRTTSETVEEPATNA